MDLKCPDCKDDLDGEQIQCDICEQWYHAVKCQEMKKSVFQVMCDRGDSIHWYCRTCSKAASKIVTNLAALATKQQQLDDRLTQAETTQSSNHELLTCKIQKLEDRLSNLESGKLPVQFSEIVKGEISREVKSSTQEIEKVLESTRADADRLQRKHNLISFKINEPNDNDSTARQQSDVRSFQSLVKDKLDMDCPAISKVMRIGKYDKDKTRPLKIVLKSAEDQRAVLSRIADMRRSKNPKLDEVFIVPDMTKEDRDRRKELRTELARRKEAGEENLVIRNWQVTKKLFRAPNNNQQASSTTQNQTSER